MAKRFAIVHAGRRIEVEPSGSWSGTTVRLLLDGDEVAEAKGSKRVTVKACGLTVRTWLAWHGESITRAELVVDGDEDARPIALDPPPGTLAARREAFARRHPGLYAARHAVSGVGKVVLGLIGISFAVRLLPDISLDLPLPSINLPLPSIDLPDAPEPPAWLLAIFESAKYWGPVLAGIAYAAVEYRRRRRGREANPRSSEPAQRRAPGPSP